MLYKFRYKNKKDIFNCSLNKITKAFDKCLESIKCVEIQTGGNNDNINNKIYSPLGVYGYAYKIAYYENKLQQINNHINISSIL
jgi:hypothetical protein